MTISRQLIDADLADLVFSGKNFSASKDAERTAGLAAPVVPIRRRAPAMCPGDVPAGIQDGRSDSRRPHVTGLASAARDPPTGTRRPSFRRDHQAML